MKKRGKTCLIAGMGITLLAAVSLAVLLIGRDDIDTDPRAVALPATRGYLLLSIDTLRADHLGAYGYERSTSPFLDELAGRGALFENAIVQLPGTLPSHMSIFTGLYPAEHGVYPPDSVLSAKISTLPEEFRRRGFRTAGFTEGGYMNGSFGFDRGFDVFDDSIESKPDDVERTLARALGFLRELSESDRFFLFVHTYAVHDPYDPPEPHRSLFWSEPVPDTFQPTGPNLTQVNRGTRLVTPETVEYFKALYDGGIHYLDSLLRDFFAELESAGFLEDMTVVITSDHGEEFLDHGKLLHEQIYHENLHVPLIFLHPDIDSGRRIPALVESVDLPATLYELAGIEPKFPLSGQSLVPLLAGREKEDPATAYAESFVDPGRALYWEGSGGIYQLLRLGVSGDGDGSWISRLVSADLPRESVRFRVLSFNEPRTLTVRVDNRLLDTVLALPDRWTDVFLDSSADDKTRRLSISTESCASPKSLGINEDTRCLSFRVADLSLDRTELYDVSSDPAQTRDLSRERSDLASNLMAHLDSYEFDRHGEGEREELSAEVSDQLRALGYLQ